MSKKNSPVAKDAKEHNGKELTSSSVEQEAREVFARLDKNSDGGIEFGELKRGLKTLGLPVTNDRDVRRMFDAMDLNKDGSISFDEFRQFVAKQVQELRQVFNAFDKNRDGTIDASELHASLRQIGLDSVDEAEVQRLMAHFKTAKGGRIQFGDWVRALLLVPAVNRVARGLMMLYFPWQASSRLQDLQTDYTAGIAQKQAQEAVEALQEELNKIQEHLYVSGKHSVLLVLQGLDTSGKDGAVKSLTLGLNASGVRIESFKTPTELERSHDYLWRVHQVCPAKGQVTIFNRSHYEDVLVVKLLKLASEEAIAKRYEQIVQFEDHLLANGTIIIKAVLHISKGEQRNRLFRRQAEHPWKLSSSDWPTHDRFDEYMDIYNTALTKTSTKSNPWHIIPADNKWFRDLALLRLVVDSLRPYHEIWKKDIGEKARTLPPFARPFPDTWAKVPAKAKL